MSRYRSLSFGVSSGLVLALLAGPAAAQSDDLPVSDGTKVPSLDAVLEVAGAAANRAEGLSELALEVSVGIAQEADQAAEVDEIDDDRFQDLRELEKARGALASRTEQWEIEDERENGMASEVVDALLAGESPAQIGVAHAKTTATAAAERREARKAAREETDTGNGGPESENPDQGAADQDAEPQGTESQDDGSQPGNGNGDEVDGETDDVESAEVEVDGDE